MMASFIHFNMASCKFEKEIQFPVGQLQIWKMKMEASKHELSISTDFFLCLPSVTSPTAQVCFFSCR